LQLRLDEERASAKDELKLTAKGYDDDDDDGDDDDDDDDSGDDDVLYNQDNDDDDDNSLQKVITICIASAVIFGHISSLQSAYIII